MWRKLKALVMLACVAVILFSAFTGMAVNKADGRASLRGYVTTPPNSWEPIGFNMTGTAAKFVVDSLGWNATRLGGNVGIGNGSLSALKELSNLNELSYIPEEKFMTGDVTSAPWSIAHISRFSEAATNETAANETAANETVARNETAAGNETAVTEAGGHKVVNTSVGNVTLVLHNEDRDINNNVMAGENNNIPAEENVTTPEIGGENRTEENVTAQETSGQGQPPMGNIGKPVGLNDPYHSILFGRPANDLLYEDPVSLVGTMYFRLVGVHLPDGSYASVGMRAVTYGY